MLRYAGWHMKKQILTPLLGCALLAFALAGLASAQTADAVVEKHLAAVGGRDALTKLTSRKSTGTVTLSTPGGEFSGPFELLMKPPNKTRLQMTIDLTTAAGAGTMTIEQRFDGTAAYATNSMQGETQISAKQVDNLRNAVFPTPLLGYKDRGAKLEQLANEKLQGKDAIVLLLTPATGSPVRMFLDPDTYLMLRTVTTVNSQQLGGDVEQTTDLSDYRTVDGLKLPFRIVTSNPAQTLTIALTKVEHNVAIDDATFVKK
jgi:outer membrane lipoprotein-sorting protein